MRGMFFLIGSIGFRVGKYVQSLPLDDSIFQPLVRSKCTLGWICPHEILQNLFIEKKLKGVFLRIISRRILRRNVTSRYMYISISRFPARACVFEEVTMNPYKSNVSVFWILKNWLYTDILCTFIQPPTIGPLFD